MPQPINVLFDGPPAAESGRFVEVELDNGRSVNAGEWIERPNGLWALRITELPYHADDALALWVTPRAIREAFADSAADDPTTDMTDEQLAEVGWAILDGIYDEYRRLLDQAIDDIKADR